MSHIPLFARAISLHQIVFSKWLWDLLNHSNWGNLYIVKVKSAWYVCHDPNMPLWFGYALFQTDHWLMPMLQLYIKCYLGKDLSRLCNFLTNIIGSYYQLILTVSHTQPILEFINIASYNPFNYYVHLPETTAVLTNIYY